MKSKAFISLAAAAVIASSCGTENFKTDEIGITVTPTENREYSYTDKKSGFWYGRTHQVEPQEWYSGWNMAKKRILADYTLSVDGNILDRSEAECTVYPDRLVRKWDNAVETFRMVDNLPIIYIAIESDSDATSISLDRSLITDSYKAGDVEFFIPGEAPDKRIMLAGDGAKGFVLTYGTEDECRALLEEFLDHGEEMIQEIARLLGSDTITDTVLQSAEELKIMADKTKVY